MAKKKEDNWCCWGGNTQRGFPTFPVILLVLGGLWLLSDIGVITFQVLWFPIILILVAVGILWDNYFKK